MTMKGGNAKVSEIKIPQECILDAINRNENGDYYIIFRLPKVARGMHGKSKGHVDELLIVGCPQKQIESFLRRYFKGELKDE